MLLIYDEYAKCNPCSPIYEEIENDILCDFPKQQEERVFFVTKLPPGIIIASSVSKYRSALA